MNREDFTEGSVHQIIFDFWDGALKTEEEFEFMLAHGTTRQALVDFIVEAHSKGRFGGGYIHE